MKKTLSNSGNLVTVIPTLPHNSTIFVPQLTLLARIDTNSSNHTPAVDQTREIISDIFPDIHQPTIDQYITQLNKFQHDQQDILRKMLSQIQQVLLKTQDI